MSFRLTRIVPINALLFSLPFLRPGSALAQTVEQQPGTFAATATLAAPARPAINRRVA